MDSALNPEIISLILAGLAWICGGITALVALAWRISSRVQRHIVRMERLERVASNHERRIRRVEEVNNILHFPNIP